MELFDELIVAEIPATQDELTVEIVAPACRIGTLMKSRLPLPIPPLNQYPNRHSSLCMPIQDWPQRKKLVVTVATRIYPFKLCCVAQNPSMPPKPPSDTTCRMTRNPALDLFRNEERLRISWTCCLLFCYVGRLRSTQCNSMAAVPPIRLWEPRLWVG